VHPAAGAAAAGSFSTAPAEADDAGADAEDDDDDPQRGWRVRRNGEPRRGRGAGLAQPHADADEDPFDGNTKLTETRRKIEDRLRHKRCDEAAALLQEIALEPGGRAIADLAMNAGDRCRALGKSNAALNCYLAASRSDPVYELPLSRLADVCIDDKDTDLAVSYLERVARIYRYRGDDKGALRVYRRIATIAPYREDVLTLLMAAQGTGRIDT
jgi:tetratricopeptide (TPR) repeat protein